MKFEIDLGHGDRLVIEDVSDKNPNNLVTVRIKNSRGENPFNGGVAKMEDIKRMARGLK